jgi:hypothetical protein
VQWLAFGAIWKHATAIPVAVSLGGDLRKSDRSSPVVFGRMSVAENDTKMRQRSSSRPTGARVRCIMQRCQDLQILVTPYTELGAIGRRSRRRRLLDASQKRGDVRRAVGATPRTSEE